MLPFAKNHNSLKIEVWGVRAPNQNTTKPLLSSRTDLHQKFTINTKFSNASNCSQSEWNTSIKLPYHFVPARAPSAVTVQYPMHSSKSQFIVLCLHRLSRSLSITSRRSGISSVHWYPHYPNLEAWIRSTPIWSSEFPTYLKQSTRYHVFGFPFSFSLYLLRHFAVFSVN